MGGGVDGTVGGSIADGDRGSAIDKIKAVTMNIGITSKDTRRRPAARHPSNMEYHATAKCDVRCAGSRVWSISLSPASRSSSSSSTMRIRSPHRSLGTSSPRGRIGPEKRCRLIAHHSPHLTAGGRHKSKPRHKEQQPHGTRSKLTTPCFNQHSLRGETPAVDMVHSEIVCPRAVEVCITTLFRAVSHLPGWAATQMG